MKLLHNLGLIITVVGGVICIIIAFKHKYIGILIVVICIFIAIIMSIKLFRHSLSSKIPMFIKKYLLKEYFFIELRKLIEVSLKPNPVKLTINSNVIPNFFIGFKIKNNSKYKIIIDRLMFNIYLGQTYESFYLKPRNIYPKEEFSDGYHIIELTGEQIKRLKEFIKLNTDTNGRITSQITIVVYMLYKSQIFETAKTFEHIELSGNY